MNFDKENLKKLMSISDDKLIEKIGVIAQSAGKNADDLKLDSEKIEKIKLAASQLSQDDIKNIMSKIDTNTIKSVLDRMNDKT